MSRRLAARHLASRDARVRHGLTRATGILVVGHAAHGLIDDGRLQRRLQRAEQVGALCIGENTFLRALDLLPRPRRPAGSMDEGAIAARSGLDPEHVSLLSLFDVIEPGGDGLFGFRELLTAKTAARLVKDGVPMSAVVASLLRLRQDDAGSAMARLERGDGGGVVLDIDGCIGELDGQLRLPLADAGNLSPEDLFAVAEQAEDADDWPEAARLYRRCIALDRSDPTPAFNLANVLCKLDRRAEAKLYLRLAVAIDPAFAEAWYNLGHLLEKEGQQREAQAHLRRALSADPDYGDALYNLAHLCLELDEYAEAAPLWQRYLLIDPTSDWAAKARRGLTLCRMHLVSAGLAKA